jgi:hypothetical protein
MDFTNPQSYNVLVSEWQKNRFPLCIQIIFCGFCITVKVGWQLKINMSGDSLSTVLYIFDFGLLTGGWKSVSFYIKYLRILSEKIGVYVRTQQDLPQFKLFLWKKAYLNCPQLDDLSVVRNSSSEVLILNICIKIEK